MERAAERCDLRPPLGGLVLGSVLLHQQLRQALTQPRSTCCSRAVNCW